MTKQIKADLDQVVEAVVVEIEKFSSGLFDVNGDGFMYPIQNDYTKQKLRTALEQFVVEEDEKIPSDILEYVDDIMHLKGLIISGKHGLFDKYKKELIEKINDIEYTTPTKGGSNG
jgi:hypothetical protein